MTARSRFVQFTARGGAARVAQNFIPRLARDFAMSGPAGHDGG